MSTGEQTSEDDDVARCGEALPETAYMISLPCTLPLGHSGDHVAANGVSWRHSMKIGICTNFTCRYKNESETAMCSRADCPLEENEKQAEGLGESDVSRGNMESAPGGGRRPEARPAEVAKRE